MTTREQITNELARLCAINTAAVRGEARLIEYGLDSLRSLELVIALEERFDLELPDELIAHVRTVDDMVALIERRLA
ncbi:MAG TPA: acyl carrier protein [Chloroflexaceae bacterium]|nr:acyl carrier protein [Chloroflexaceae bacterium]